MNAHTLALLAVTPGWTDLAARRGIDGDTVGAVIDEAQRFADAILTPLGRLGDAQGCRLEAGRVRTPEGYAQTYARMGADGWLAMDLPESLDGQGLPTTLHAAASPAFEGAAMAFMMANGSSRAAAHLLAGSVPELAAAWVPRLASGEWAATICISEPDAGSDVGRIRTRAEPDGDGWRISGSKCWISFGDHDMGTRIGHLLLARTGPAEAGTRGLSLFLVPDRLDDSTPNGVSATRVEEKMGLHGSPTCVMAFDGARGTMIGEPGRGLVALFPMIELMRLQTACQGLGVAQRACDIAEAYAKERLQGGPPDAAPVAIDRHADVRRQLTSMRSRCEVLRSVILDLALTLDQAGEGDAKARILAAFLLPLAKNFGGETGFSVASDAIQVLGGAGYTREWPVEQLARDARVIAIYEGTTGMQAQDFLTRRLLRERGEGLALFRARAQATIADCPDAAAAERARAVLDRFAALSAAMLEGGDGMAAPDLAADGYLRAGWAAVSAAACCRMIAASAELARLGRFRLRYLDAEMALAEASCRLDAALVSPTSEN